MLSQTGVCIMSQDNGLYGINQYGFYFKVAGSLCDAVQRDSFKGQLFNLNEKDEWQNSLPEPEEPFYAWHFEYCELRKDIVYTDTRGISNLCDTTNFQRFLETFEV